MYPWKTWQGMTLIIKVCLLWRVLACGILPAVTLGSCILFGCSRLYSFLFLPSVVTYSAQKLQAQRDGLLVVRKNKKPRQGRTAAPGFSHALWRLLCTTARPAALCGRLCAPVGVPGLLWYLCPPGHSKAVQGRRWPAGQHEKPRQAVEPAGAVPIH